VHVSSLSKYDELELKSELTLWVSRRARARVTGPSGVGEVDTGVGVDVSLLAMSSSARVAAVGSGGSAGSSAIVAALSSTAGEASRRPGATAPAASRTVH
jgi:hypothetical protein